MYKKLIFFSQSDEEGALGFDEYYLSASRKATAAINSGNTLEPGISRRNDNEYDVSSSLF